jgi:hypothetical protein
MSEPIVLRCSRDLALRLGAVAPDDAAHFRALAAAAGGMLIRDVATGWPLFWPPARAEAVSSR